MAISLVQTPTVATGSTSTVTKTFGSNTTTGNFIVVAFVAGTSSQPSFTVTDNKSNTYTKIVDQGQGAVWLQVWYAWNITGGASHTVTINNPGTLGVNGYVREYSGVVNTFDPIDQSAVATGSSTSFSSGASPATTVAYDLVIGAFGDDWGAASTYTVGAGYGNLVSNVTGAAGGINLEDKIVTLTGAQTATLTDNNNPQWVAAVVAFKGQPTITRVGSSHDNATMPAGTTTNDLVFIHAANLASSTIPSTPSGYTQLTSSQQSADNNAMAIFYKFAGASESYPSITNATDSVCVVYRGVDTTTPFSGTGGQNSATGGSTTISFSGIGSFANPNADWVVITATSSVNGAAMPSFPPTSTTAIDNDSNFNAIFDTGGPVASYSFNSKTLSASSVTMTKTTELHVGPAPTAPITIKAAVIGAALPGKTWLNRFANTGLRRFFPVQGLPVLQVEQTTAYNSGAGTSGTATLVFTATPATGNLLVVGLSLAYNKLPVTAPAGWTLLDSGGAGGNAAFAVFTHIVKSGEANSYAFNTNGGDFLSAVGYEVTGQAAYGYIDQHAFTPGLNVTSLATPTVTPGAIGELGISFYFMNDGTGESTTQPNPSIGWVADFFPEPSFHAVTSGHRLALTDDTVTGIKNTWDWGVNSDNAISYILTISQVPIATQGQVISTALPGQTWINRFAKAERRVYMPPPIPPIGNQYSQNLTATLSHTGAIVKQIGYPHAASVSFSGNIVRVTGKNMVATVTFTGTFGRAIAHVLAATLNFTGAIAKLTNRSHTATLSFTGSNSTITIHHLALTASVSFTGAQSKQIQKALVAAVTESGAMQRNIQHGLTATVSPSGNLTKRTARALAATISFSGAFVHGAFHALALTASVAFSGAFSKQTNKNLAATGSFTGTNNRQISRPLSATVSFTGSFTKRVNRALAATLSHSGSFVWRVARSFAATLSFTGTHTKQTQRNLSGGVGYSGAMAKRTNRNTSATVTPAGQVNRRVGRPLNASVTPTGNFARTTMRAFTAAVSYTGGFLSNLFHIMRSTPTRALFLGQKNNDVHLGSNPQSRTTEEQGDDSHLPM